jgi:hypothetical protein
MIFVLLWLQVIPEQGVRYHHLATFDNETMCMSELRHAAVMVNDKSETIECIGVMVK